MGVTTRQGVDFIAAARTVPLSTKLLGFLDRDAQYRLVAREGTGGETSEEARALAIFEWTRRRIRMTPQGSPVVDDHIWHIIIRGHGLDDQMADVFTTLCTYAGVSAFWEYLHEPSGKTLVLSFVRIHGRWTVFDVAHGLVFRDAEGRLDAVDELLADPALVERTAGRLRPWGEPYARYLEGFAFEVPHPLRAELQRPWPRLWYELRRALGRAGEDNAGEAAR
jgi:hypothetical protein